MKIGIQKTVDVEIKTIEIMAKVRDTLSLTLKDQNNDVVLDYDGYVPGFFPEDHYGDYVQLNIDIESGLILNWNKPTVAELSEFYNDSKDN